MGRLTTHVLDTANGRPGNGMAIDLYRRTADGDRVHIKRVETNTDGRVDGPVLEGDAFAAGVYEFEFFAGEYFRSAGTALPEPAFVDVALVRFGIADPSQHYHVPLLVSPWSYSTYRGS